jgi:hypothetical protein
LLEEPAQAALSLEDEPAVVAEPPADTAEAEVPLLDLATDAIAEPVLADATPLEAAQPEAETNPTHPEPAADAAPMDPEA